MCFLTLWTVYHCHQKSIQKNWSSSLSETLEWSHLVEGVVSWGWSFTLTGPQVWMVGPVVVCRPSRVELCPLWWLLLLATPPVALRRITLQEKIDRRRDPLHSLPAAWCLSHLCSQLLPISGTFTHTRSSLFFLQWNSAVFIYGLISYPSCRVTAPPTCLPW